MLDKNLVVTMTNRDNGSVGYKVPDMGIERNFEPGETKEVTVEEIRKLSYLNGGMYELKNCFIIHNEELVEEILHHVEPEYYYTEEDIKELVLHGTLEQFLDTLDFAPLSVIDMMKEQCVKLEVNDIRKRTAILEKTGFNVTKAIEIEHETEKDEDEVAAPVRRSAPINAATASNTGRRSPQPPQYNVIDK